MPENPDESIEEAPTAVETSIEMGSFPDSGNATYRVQFSKFLSRDSRARNSLALARRGEIRFSSDGIVVRAYQREMMFMGSRIELAFASSNIMDVSRSGNFVSLRIAAPNQDLQNLGFWTQDEEDAKNIVQALPKTLSAAGLAEREYEAQLALLDRGDLATKVIVAANALVFGAAGIAGAGFFVPNAEVLQAWGTNFGPLTTGGQWWRLVTSMFLHFGAFHIALNMWALYVGGRLAERLYGSRAFVLLYFASGIAGSLASLLWNPAVNSAGASGAIFGVYAAVLAFYLRKHTAIPPSIVNQQRWSGVAFIGFNLMNGFSHSGIDNAAHIGGLLVGFAMGLVLARPLGLAARAQVNSASFYARGCIAALVMIGLLFVALRFSAAGNAADQRFRRDLLSMAKTEAIALQSAKEAFEGLRTNQITAPEFAARIAKDVLPRWVMIQSTFQRDRVADNSQLKPLWELLDDYSASRLAAYQLFESAGRTGNTADFKRAQAKVDQGDIDLKLIRELNQNPQK